MRYEPLPGADRLIHYKISDIVLKINAEEWFDVKQPIFSTVAVDLPDTARRLYTKLEREFLAELESGTEIEAMNAAVKSGKCLQLASGAVYTDGESFEEVHKAKLDALRSIVEEAGGMPILVSYQFKHEAVRIQRSFPKAKLLDKNPRTLRDWNAGKIPLLLAHPASCGHGLSMRMAETFSSSLAPGGIWSTTTRSSNASAPLARSRQGTNVWSTSTTSSRKTRWMRWYLND